MEGVKTRPNTSPVRTAGTDSSIEYDKVEFTHEYEYSSTLVHFRQLTRPFEGRPRLPYTRYLVPGTWVFSHSFGNEYIYTSTRTTPRGYDYHTRYPLWYDAIDYFLSITYRMSYTVHLIRIIPCTWYSNIYCCNTHLLVLVASATTNYQVS